MSDVSQKEYFDRVIHDLDRRYEQRFEAQNLAIRKAEAAIDERLRGMNEFRRAMDDMTRTFTPLAAYQKLDDAVNDLQRAKANLDGRMAVISFIVSALVSLGVVGVSAFLRR